MTDEFRSIVNYLNKKIFQYFLFTIENKYKGTLIGTFTLGIRWVQPHSTLFV